VNLWTVFFLAALADAPITMHLTPAHHAFEPSHVIVTVRAEPVETDRELHVVLDGPSFFRATSYGLEGEAAPRTHRIEWRAVPAGEYVVSASIGPPGRIRAHVARELRILSRS
jgi:hypothetical protein